MIKVCKKDVPTVKSEIHCKGLDKGSQEFGS